MRVVALGLALLPMSSAAQDLTAQDLAAIAEYGAAYQTFGMGEMSYDWDAMVAQTDTMLNDLTGTWINAGQLSAGPDFNSEVWLQACDRSVSRVERRGLLGFALIRSTRDGDALTYLHSFIAGRTFALSVDPEEWQDFMRIPEEQRPFQAAYTGGGTYGFVSVFHPSPLTMVIQPMVGIADIYVRCP